MFNKKIGVIGLGYVGLPIAVEFGKIRPVVGYDIDAQRIYELKSGLDSTLEITKTALNAAINLEFTYD